MGIYGIRLHTRLIQPCCIVTDTDMNLSRSDTISELKNNRYHEYQSKQQ